MVGAVILAAGASRRMGRPKMPLPWREGRSILQQVIYLAESVEADPILVVTGSDREVVEALLHGTRARPVHNPAYRQGGMLSSIQAGLRVLERTPVQAALLMPGDLPKVRPATVRMLLEAWGEEPARLVVPSFRHRAGHPVVIPRERWPEILALGAGETLRDFFRRHQGEIRYVVVQDGGVLQDVDTPEAYRRALQEEPQGDEDAG